MEGLNYHKNRAEIIKNGSWAKKWKFLTEKST